METVEASTYGQLEITVKYIEGRAETGRCD